MATLLRMPEISASMTEAVIQEWKVGENAAFAAGDTLAEIETDKAVIDFEAEAPGVLLRLLVAPGQTVEVGAPIAILGAPDEAGTDVEALLPSLGLSSTADTDGSSAPGSTADAATGGGPADLAGTRIFASPLARKLARESGLSLDALHGTGPGGRIVRADIEAARSAAPAPPRASSAPTPLPSTPVPSTPLPSTPVPSTPVQAAPQLPPTQTPVAPGAWTDTPHSRLRRTIAQRLTESKQHVPHFYLRRAARVDALMQLRSQANAATDRRISVNDLVVKAAAVALRRMPEMNVIWTDDALRRFHAVDLAVAIAGEKGLVTPVIRGADRLSVGEVSTVVRDFVTRAGTGQLKQHELEGGAFAVTNLGMFGVDEFDAIINPPQSAILAVGAAQRTPVVDTGADGDETVVIATTLQLTLSVDHRAVDGALAARWLGVLVGILEQPLQILL